MHRSSRTRAQDWTCLSCCMQWLDKYMFHAKERISGGKALAQKVSEALTKQLVCSGTGAMYLFGMNGNKSKTAVCRKTVYNHSKCPQYNTNKEYSLARWLQQEEGGSVDEAIQENHGLGDGEGGMGPSSESENKHYNTPVNRQQTAADNREHITLVRGTSSGDRESNYEEREPDNGLASCENPPADMSATFDDGGNVHELPGPDYNPGVDENEDDTATATCAFAQAVLDALADDTTAGLDLLASDIKDELPQARLKSLSNSQEFICLIQSATLDNDKLNKYTPYRLRHPVEGRIDITSPDDKLSLEIFAATDASEATYTCCLKAVQHCYPDSGMLSFHNVKQLVAQDMLYMDQKVTEVNELLKALKNDANMVYDVIFCGSDLVEFAESIHITSRDTMISFSVDGVQLYQNKKSDTWIGVFLVNNYSPNLCFKQTKVLPGIIIPGPNKPKLINSFLFCTFYHLAALQHENNGKGLAVWDAGTQSIFHSRILFALATADAVGMTKLDGCVGHHGVQGSQLGCSMKGQHKPNSGHYFAAHMKPNDYTVEDCNHPDVDIHVLEPQSVKGYNENIQMVLSSPDQATYDRNQKATGLSKPSLISGLVKELTLPVPSCFPLDLMHLLALNIPDLLISLWHGTIKPLNNDFLECVTLVGETWVAHGKLVEEATQHFPSSFHHTPCNPAEKISSGFKATEWSLYLYGLGPAFFRTILPCPHWQNFCKLAAAVQIFVQHRLTGSQITMGHSLTIQFVEEYENLYYQRHIDRLQNAYGLRDEAEYNALKDGFDMDVVQQYGCVSLPNGQIVRSVFNNKKHTRRSRISNNVKINLNKKITYAKVRFYFYVSTEDPNQLDGKEKLVPWALASIYSDPDFTILTDSFNTVWACRKTGSAFPASSIISLVSMQPMPMFANEPKDLWFPVEKSSLEEVQLGEFDLDNMDT
ncbi:hypothetical protein DXG01_000540 [Tephrocybe rancida]|nr:hypothetical protein DXG01_000540 [Tephrocybe rancida]